jgi:hypothetical protein
VLTWEIANAQNFTKTCVCVWGGGLWFREIFHYGNWAKKDFSERHTGHSIPGEATLRKNYTRRHNSKKCYGDAIRRITERVRRWFSSPSKKTGNVQGRYTANVIVGTMKIDGPSEIFLLTTESLGVRQPFGHTHKMLRPFGLLQTCFRTMKWREGWRV